MANLIKRYTLVLHALQTLDEVINDYNPETASNSKMNRYLRDALIKRFEYSIDTLWKFLKIYLQEQLVISIEFNTPRGIIQEAVNANIITQTQQKILLQCLNNRNETSHTYNEHLAEQLVHEIPLLYPTMLEIIKALGATLLIE